VESIIGRSIGISFLDLTLSRAPGFEVFYCLGSVDPACISYVPVTNTVAFASLVSTRSIFYGSELNYSVAVL
jgi:hypothetical protein